jgi:predicted nucleic-acid-binding protein
MIQGDTSLDTSVVLRLLVAEPADQYQSATDFLQQRLDADTRVHISELVLAEAYFALQSFYGLPKKDAIDALSLFASHSGITVSPSAAEVLAQPNLAASKPGFVDRLIHGISNASGQTLVTFEKAAKKLPTTHVLSGVRDS